MMQYDASQVRINIRLKNIHLLNEKDGNSVVLIYEYWWFVCVADNEMDFTCTGLLWHTLQKVQGHAQIATG